MIMIVRWPQATACHEIQYGFHNECFSKELPWNNDDGDNNSSLLNVFCLLGTVLNGLNKSTAHLLHTINT